MLRSTLVAFTAAVLAAQAPAPAPAPAPTPAAPAPMPAPQAKKELVPPPARTLPGAKKEAPAPKVDKVLATISGKVIRESDFELFLSMALNPQQRMQVEMVQGAKDQYRKQFLDTKVIAAAARKEGLGDTPEFRRKMELMELQVLLEAILRRDDKELKAKIAVNDADVKAYYDKHTEQFRSPESFNARHILVSIKDANAPKEAKGLTEEEAKAKVALAAKALAEGKGWEAVAKEFSDDPGSKDKGGLYENISYGSFVPEFEEAVRKQELGKVGEPVKTKYGFHLIQAEKRTPAEVLPFDKAKTQAQQKAQMAKQEEVFQAYVDKLKKEVGFAAGEAKPEAKEPAKAAAKGRSAKKSGAKK